MIVRLNVAFLIAIVLANLFALKADASISLVTSRATLAGTDNLDWGDLGPDDPGYGNNLHPNPLVIASDDGLSVTVSQVGGPFERLDQAANFPPPWTGGWNGNFAIGDELLWTTDAVLGTGITLNFGSTAIESFGLQIQGSNFLGPFTAHLEAFDSGGNSLGTVSRVGNSTQDRDNSAIFIGLLSDAPSTDFHSVLVAIDAPPGASGGFAINQVDFSPASTDPGVVPEASTVFIWGLLGLSTLIPKWCRRPRDD
jgi:hypothetical protein